MNHKDTVTGKDCDTVKVDVVHKRKVRQLSLLFQHILIYVFITITIYSVGFILYHLLQYNIIIMVLINIINIQLVQSARARGADCITFIINLSVSELYNIYQVLVNIINMEYTRPCFYTSYLHMYELLVGFMIPI